MIEATEGLEIGLLVSNAAMVLGGALVKTELADQMKAVQVNITSALSLIHHCAQAMSERGRGGIVIVAALGGYASMPFMANYMASKAYLISFGEALHDELEKDGVDVTVLNPGVTKTGVEFKSKGIDGTQLAGWMERGMAVTPVVSSALAALGKKTTVVPGWVNRSDDPFAHAAVAAWYDASPLRWGCEEGSLGRGLLGRRSRAASIVSEDPLAPEHPDS